MILYKQLSLEDIFQDCQNKFDHDKYEFPALLDQIIDLDEIVLVSFVSHFHTATDRCTLRGTSAMIINSASF